jgi:hypothetical protein
LTYLPLSLFQSSRRRRNEPSLDSANKPESSSVSFVLRPSVLAALQVIEDRRRRKDRRNGKSLPTTAPQTLAAINHLLAQSIFGALAWPIRRRRQDFVVLPSGLGDLNSVPSVAGVLFFGGRVRTQRIIDLEDKVSQSGKDIDRAIDIALKWYRSNGRVQPLGYGGIVKVNPRVIFKPLKLSSVQYQDPTIPHGTSSITTEPWRPAKYRVPVFSMVDMLGQEKALELVKDTQFEGYNWVAIKYGQHTAPCLEWLIKGAFWFSESK